MRLLISIGAMLCIIVAASQGWAQQPAAIPVGTLAAELRPITKSTEFVGRVEAMERVEIRARVTGFLQDILFKDGRWSKRATSSTASSGTASTPRSSRRVARCWKRKGNTPTQRHNGHAPRNW